MRVSTFFMHRPVGWIFPAPPDTDRTASRVRLHLPYSIIVYGG